MGGGREGGRGWGEVVDWEGKVMFGVKDNGEMCTHRSPQMQERGHMMKQTTSAADDGGGRPVILAS